MLLCSIVITLYVLKNNDKQLNALIIRLWLIAVSTLTGKP